jgi:hypothetical protein
MEAIGAAPQRCADESRRGSSGGSSSSSVSMSSVGATPSSGLGSLIGTPLSSWFSRVKELLSPAPPQPAAISAF